MQSLETVQAQLQLLLRFWWPWPFSAPAPAAPGRPWRHGRPRLRPAVPPVLLQPVSLPGLLQRPWPVPYGAVPFLTAPAQGGPGGLRNAPGHGRISAALHAAGGFRPWRTGSTAPAGLTSRSRRSRRRTRYTRTGSGARLSRTPRPWRTRTVVVATTPWGKPAHTGRSGYRVVPEVELEVPRQLLQSRSWMFLLPARHLSAGCSPSWARPAPGG